MTGIRVVTPPAPPEPPVGSIAVFVVGEGADAWLVPVERGADGWFYCDTTGTVMTWELTCAENGNPVGVVALPTLTGGSE